MSNSYSASLLSDSAYDLPADTWLVCTNCYCAFLRGDARRWSPDIEVCPRRDCCADLPSCMLWADWRQEYSLCNFPEVPDPGVDYGPDAGFFPDWAGGPDLPGEGVA